MQKIITSGKGIAIDYDAVARDSQAHSKEIYLWGQEEDTDIKDGELFFLFDRSHRGSREE